MLVFSLFLSPFLSAKVDVIDGRALTLDEEKTFENIFRIRAYTTDGLASGCSSTLIAPKVLLTAAHCLSQGFPEVILNRSSKNEDYKSIYLDKVHSVKIFPRYDAFNLVRRNKQQIKDNQYEGTDVALIILKDEISVHHPAAKNFTYFELMTSDELEKIKTDASSEMSFSFFGFGSRSFTEKKMFFDLQMAELPMYQKIRTYLFKDDETHISSFVFPNYKLGKGDSGGPVILKTNGTNYLVGINSLASLIDESKPLSENHSYHTAFTKDIICWMVASSPFQSKLCPAGDPLIAKYQRTNDEQKEVGEKLFLKLNNEILDQEFTVKEATVGYNVIITYLKEGNIYRMTLTGDVQDRCYFDSFHEIQDRSNLEAKGGVIYQLFALCDGKSASYNILVRKDGFRIKRY